MVGARATRLLALLGAIPLLGTCGPTGEPPQAPAPTAPSEASPALRGWHYEVEVAPSLERADVRICFSGSAPNRLIPGLRIADPHAHDVRDAAGEPLPRQGMGYALGSLGEDACVDYWVDFAGLESSGAAGRMIGRTGDSLMVRPSLWMWRPDMLPAEADATIHFTMPEGMQVSVPWPAREGAPRGDADTTYALTQTAFHWLAYAVFGELTIDRFEHAGTEVELVVLDAELACPSAGLRTWVHEAMDTVALLFDGRFPRERLQMVVLPIAGGGEGTVYFGMAGRGGGPGIYVFLDDHAQAQELPGGWTTIHEMLHHGMPFIDEPWMAEGWVTYYTELMRTRMGFRSEQEGWRALAKGLARGRRRGQDLTLAQASAQMHEAHLYQRVYWGGAATALLIDVTMRVQTQGARGLDDAMKELRRCCGDATHLWPARDLLATLDTWYGRPLFTQTADAVLSQRGFPDTDAALASIGVTVSGDEVRLDEDPARAEIRRAIMAPRRATEP
ncbi:MAG: hypothetical protein AAGF11_36695 [Myxococcota bacterium]